jgi:hypothetical protein
MRRVEISAAAGRRFAVEVGGEPATSNAFGRKLAGFAFVLAMALHAASMGGSFPRPSDWRGAFVSREPPSDNTAEAQAERTMRAARMMAAGVAVSAVIQTASGADLVVPSKQFPTIQAAVNAAVDGDVIHLAQGTFVESCTVQGKSVSFVGSGMDATRWEAPAGHRCLWMPFGDSKALAITDIHFTGFDMPYNAAAVDLESTGAHRVSRCRISSSGYFSLETFGPGSIIEDCEFLSNTGSGVSMTIPESQSPQLQTIRRCRFFDNTNRFDTRASAIAVYNTLLRVENCEFRRNNWPSGNGKAIQVDSGQLTVQGCVFCDSSSSPITGAWADGGGNTFTSSCTPPCPTDLVHDGATNGADMAVLLNFWGTNGSQYPGVDLNSDGIVDGTDLAMLLNAWGPCPQ